MVRFNDTMLGWCCGFFRLIRQCSHDHHVMLYTIGHIDVGGGGPRVVISTAAFHARVRGSYPGLGGLKKTKMFLPHPLVKTQYCGEPP